ncbi:uncharacterized protein LOC120625321 [Pararge aegeria]|uniref:uncharacterized protein LOC120625321 n=1 Tax=Pararge aegeria TaxID=116150 RepID=UPI0019D23B2C|nr:uncharacterized protein LOC120625321 [Pararge aegeria]
MKQLVPILLMTVTIRVIDSQKQDETKNIEFKWPINEGEQSPLKNQEINKIINDISDDNLNDEVVYKSTFQERLKMLPVKVVLQLMKAKNGLSNGMAKTMQGNRRMMEGLLDSSGTLFDILKDGFGNMRTLVFGN